jgi:homoserine kinase
MSGFRMRLPATSANLGSGFDAAAVALDFHLAIEAEEASEFSIHATGLDVPLCSRVEGNLILDSYRAILADNGSSAPPLALRMHNEIPLGMGCGSSAAGRLAAVAMAAHFGRLGWCGERILEEACVLEGHPDNAAACWLGGFVAAANNGRAVRVARVEPPSQWRAIVVLPNQSLATKQARAVLPETYPAADAIANIQAVSMLGLAFSQGRGDLLQTAMRDRIHQPYRAEICPLLPRLLPLAGKDGILGVALSGAGPSVLAIIEGESWIESASRVILDSLQGLPEPRLRVSRYERGGANRSLANSG